MSLIQELRRRNVIRVGIAYIVAAWLVIQVVETLFPVFDFSNESIRLVVLVLAIGLLPVLFFAWAFELTPEGVKREKDIDRGQSITPQTGKKLDRWVIVLLAVALAYFTFDKFILDPARDADLVKTTTQIAEQAVLSRTSEKSIAVLPFVNMSADPDQEYFSDGISEEILNALSQVNAFKVAGRTSSFAFKGRNDDLRLIGEALNVAHVLEGSVRKSGGRLRITAQLIKVDDGYHLWSQTFDRELTDVFAIQDEIASAILDQLKIQFLGGGHKLSIAARTDTEAYELYLRGKQLVYERQPEFFELASNLLDRSILLDPDYAPAHAQRGILWLLQEEDVYGDIPTAESSAQARKHFDRALKLNPELAEAWAGRGLDYLDGTIQGNQQAIEAFEKALAINPYLPDALNWYQQVLSFTEALVILEKILEYDPLYPPAIRNLVGKYNQLEQYEKSLALLDRIKPFLLEQRQYLGFYGATYFQMGHYAKAQQALEATDPEQHITLSHRYLLPYIWNETHQFERTISVPLTGSDETHAKSIALWHVGREEEALSLALEQTDLETAVEYLMLQPYFQILNASGKSQVLIEYVEAKWTLDEIEARGPIYRDLMGYAPLNEIAYAYIQAGEPEKANDALKRVKEGQEKLETPRRQVHFMLNRAVYFTLTGNHEDALDYLESAIDGGYIGSTRLAKLWTAFESLESDPRYQAIQSKMIKHLNEERRELGLEPVTD